MGGGDPRLGDQEGVVVCPRCGAAHPTTERFCEDCGLPLVYAEHATAGLPDDELSLPGIEPASLQRRTARKIDPRYAEGEPVKAIGARNQAEAEFIQNLLLEEGIPSMQRRSRGFDAPDFLAGGVRDVLVPQSGLDAAREVLMQSELLDPADPAANAARPVAWKLLAWILGALVLMGLVVELAMQL